MEKLASASGELGSRAAPTQVGKNDAKIGLRLDYGKEFQKDGKKYGRLNLQVNKKAENTTLKDLASKDYMRSGLMQTSSSRIRS